MSEIFFTSDTHFYHSSILKFSPNRGEIWATAEAMNEGMRELWNKTVKPNDTVYNLGDLAYWKKFNKEEYNTFFKSLNGKKHWINGNHDKGLPFFDAFSSRQDYLEIRIVNQPIMLFHFPMRTWDKVGYGSWHLWGHVHGRLPPHGKSVDVGIDSSWVTGKHEHRPFHYDEIKSFMDKQPQSEKYGD